MANKSANKSTTITVAVVGITSSALVEHGGEGAGKSCLCNRFVRSHFDQYYYNHPYIVNYSEFGNSVINSTHFLYWGDKISSLEDSSEICFRVIEHTEFVEDMSLKPFHSQKSYHKRIAVTKLQSGGKLQYVAPNQLTLPEEYTSVTRFPDRSVQVDGFVLCIDSSAPFSPGDVQYDETIKIISVIQSTKKPFVIALTKCDKSDPSTTASIVESIGKLKKVSTQTIEVSSHESINIDLCFLYLAHLIDSRKPRSHVVSYREALNALKIRIQRNEESFKVMLSNKLTDFTMQLEEAKKVFRYEVEWDRVAQFKGEQRCFRLIQLRLTDLKEMQIQKQSEIYMELLPECLNALLPSVSLTDTIEMCLALLREDEKFDDYFVDLKDWREDNEFIYSFSHKVPFSFLENEGKSCLEKHISQLQLEQKKELALVNVKKALDDASNLQPGMKVDGAMTLLGLTEQAELILRDDLQVMFNKKISEVEQKCSEEIHELLLERLDLFLNYTPDTKEIVEKLQDEPRMKIMELAPIRRDGIIVKHISNLEVLTKGPYYTPDILSALSSNCPRLESLKSELWSLHEEDSDVFNLAILGMNSEEIIKLRSDIMNTCSDEIEINSFSYQLNMNCFSGNESFSDLNTEDFTPHGAVILVTSLSGLEWAGFMCTKLFLSSESPLYRGLPCVMLVVDRDLYEGRDKSEIYNQAKQLSTQLQCVLISTQPTELPNRLVTQDIVHSSLMSLSDAVLLTRTFLTKGPSLEEDGLNFDVFSLPGDPIDVQSLFSDLCSQQLVNYTDDKRHLYTKIALEKQHKMATLAFYSTINATDFGKHPVLGYILIYSADRKASLAAVKWLIPRLHDIQILLVAMTTDTTSPLVAEGESIANNSKKMQFITCHSQLSIKNISEFCSKCFFSRFTTWNSQQLPDDVVARLCRRKNLMRSIPQPHGTLPHKLSRHSVAVTEGPERAKTLSRASIKSHFFQQEAEEDDPTYTNPMDIKRELMISPSRVHFPNRSTPDIPHSHPMKLTSPDADNSDYAIFPDMAVLNKLDTLTRGQRMSRFEEDPDIEEENDLPEEEEEELTYANPRDTMPLIKKHRANPERTPPPLPPREKLYNHLTPKTKRKLMEEGISLANAGMVESLYSFAEASPQEPSLQNLYSLANEPEIQDVGNHRGLYSYAMVDKGKGDVSETIYSEPEIPWRSHSPSSSPRSVSPIEPRSTSPLNRIKPKIPPKPTAKQVTKPNVLNTRLSPKRTATSHELTSSFEDQQQRYRHNTSPLLQRRTIQHVVTEDESIYAIPTKIPVNKSTDDDRRPLIAGNVMSDEDDDDEATPSVPMRYYTLSDIEDDDNDLFSDNEDSTSNEDVPFVSAGVYDSIGSITSSLALLAPPSTSTRASMEVSEMEAVYMNFNELKKQLAAQESIYDTLEKVVEAVNNPTAPTIQIQPVGLPSLSKNALKLMQKMEKKAQREAMRRRKAEAKKLKKEEDEAKRAIKKGKKPKKKTQRKRYFGMPLASIIDEEEDGVPALVKDCILMVERDGMEVEGIYRVPGRKEDIIKFQEKYDRNNKTTLEGHDGLCINGITGVLKNFFKLLPDPLIVEDVLPGLLEVPGNNDLNAQKGNMHQVLSRLPKENLQTLAYIVNHLHRVQQHHTVNKMNASNLSIVFWPTLMRPPLADLADPGKQLGFQLSMAKMIESPDFVPSYNQ